MSEYFTIVFTIRHTAWLQRGLMSEHNVFSNIFTLEQMIVQEINKMSPLENYSILCICGAMNLHLHWKKKNKSSYNIQFILFLEHDDVLAKCLPCLSAISTDLCYGSQDVRRDGNYVKNAILRITQAWQKINIQQSKRHEIAY